MVLGTLCGVCLLRGVGFVMPLSLSFGLVGDLRARSGVRGTDGASTLSTRSRLLMENASSGAGQGGALRVLMVTRGLQSPYQTGVQTVYILPTHAVSHASHALHNLRQGCNQTSFLDGIVHPLRQAYQLGTDIAWLVNIGSRERHQATIIGGL